VELGSDLQPAKQINAAIATHMSARLISSLIVDRTKSMTLRRQTSVSPPLIGRLAFIERE
jgi:hypothetical protein